MNRESWANLRISIYSRDGPQDDFKRSESFSDILCGIDANGDTPKQCSLPGSLRNWWTLKEYQRRHGIDTYLLMPLLARSLSLQRHKYPRLGRHLHEHWSQSQGSGVLTRGIPPVPSTANHNTRCRSSWCGRLLVFIHSVLKHDSRTLAALFV